MIFVYSAEKTWDIVTMLVLVTQHLPNQSLIGPYTPWYLLLALRFRCATGAFSGGGGEELLWFSEWNLRISNPVLFAIVFALKIFFYSLRKVTRRGVPNPPPPFPFPLSLASGEFVLEESKIWFCFFWFVKVNPKTTPKQPQKIVSSYLTLSFINFENVFFQLNKKNRVRVNNGAQEIMKTGNINNFCFHYFHRC